MHVALGHLIRPATWVACGNNRSTGVAVVRTVERHHLAATGVQASHPDRVFNRICTTVGEEDLVESLGRQFNDALGGLTARLVGVLRRNRRKLGSLLLNRGDHLGVLVTNVGVHQLAGEVEKALTVVVPDVRTLATGDEHGIQRALGRPRVEYVRAVQVVDLLATCGVWREFSAHIDSQYDGLTQEYGLVPVRAKAAGCLTDPGF